MNPASSKSAPHGRAAEPAEPFPSTTTFPLTSARSGPVDPAATRTAVRPDRRGIIWFLVLAFAGSWVPWAVVGLLGLPLSNPVIQLLTGALMPAIAAVVVRRWITREGFSDAGLRPRFRQSWRHYLAALAIPMAMVVIGCTLAWAFGLWDPTTTDITASLLPVLFGPLLIIATAPLFLGEEFGWTAYLRDRLLPGRPVATTFVTGVIWAVWHWPLPWVGYFDQQASAGQAAVAMLMWLPLCILLEFLIGWLWAESGSIWPSAIIHGGTNLIVAVTLGNLLPEINPGVLTGVLCLTLCPFVAWVIIARKAGGATRRQPAELG